MKILALTTISGPYIIARYSAFANKFSSYLLQLMELGRVSDIYQWQTNFSNVPYHRLVLSEQSVQSQDFLRLSNLMLKHLKQSQADVIVICGYGVPGMLTALLWSIWNRKPAILLSETQENDATRIWWQEKIKSWIVRQYKSALVGGKFHKLYLMKLGMPEEAIFLGYDVVDNAIFNPSQISHLREPLKKPFFLAINRFVPKKNLLFLLSSYAEYRQQAGDRAWDLVLGGDGELREQIETKICQLNLQPNVHLPGFLQQDELLPYFAHASCFVHTSTVEQWGLVVNEAMAAALPVLVSERCGCVEDLIIEGVNGFSFNPENQQQLVNLMLKLHSEEINLKQMGNAALEHIQKFSPDYFAQGLIQAVEYAIAH